MSEVPAWMLWMSITALSVGCLAVMVAIERLKWKLHCACDEIDRLYERAAPGYIAPDLNNPESLNQP